MSAEIATRFATVNDAALLARHRVGMFHDMGVIRADTEPRLASASQAYFARAIATGEYVGWVAHPVAEPGAPVAGAGVQIRSMLPRPDSSGEGLLLGREGLVLNVYVDRAWRRRGIARRLMEAIVLWAKTAGIVRLVLHASDEGRPLYEDLGFVLTNEMRYRHQLAASGPVVGME